MKYALVYAQRAEKDIRKLDPQIRMRVGKALLNLQSNPIGLSEMLTDPRIGTYRFRVGDYRVVFESDIVVLRIGHRKEIYKR
jgi:mRNA interferase RelE/StbE